MSVPTTTPRVQAPIEYPESDGQPMAETDVHIRNLIDTRFALIERYRDDPQVYVAGNLLIYYQQDNPQASFAPDVFVVFGAPNHERRIYKLWEEGKAPDVIFEFTARGTQEDDLRHKRWLYEQLGVREYFLFDPLGEYLQPKLQGFRLQQKYYVPLPDQSTDGGEWRLESETLRLELITDGSRLRLFDVERGVYLHSPQEAEAAYRAEAEARRTAEAHARALEAELARLKAELEKLKSNQ